MIDFRYHLASLMAVFLALGIGMLIGNSFVGLASVEGQTQALQRLQEDVAVVRRQVLASQQENARLKQNLNERDSALRALAPSVLNGLLSNRRVAILHLGPPRKDDITAEISGMLTSAGAQVASITQLEREWLPRDPTARDAILRRLQVTPGENNLQRATQTLMKALVSGDWNTALQEISTLTPGVSLSGDYTIPVGAVVVVLDGIKTEGPTAQSHTEFENALLSALKDRGIRMVATETESTSFSQLPLFQNQGIPTIDNIDTALGQIACAVALANGEASIGARPTEDRTLPDLMLPPPTVSPASKDG